MDKRDNYRIITNSRGRFRIQKLKSFFGLKWWGRSFSNTSFFRFWSAEHAIEEQLGKEQRSREYKLECKEGQEGPWNPI